MLQRLLLSFVYVGVYRNNHHHMLPRHWAHRYPPAEPVGQPCIHLLFWLSLVPGIPPLAGWARNHFAADPSGACNGVNLFYGGTRVLADLADEPDETSKDNHLLRNRRSYSDSGAFGSRFLVCGHRSILRPAICPSSPKSIAVAVAS